MNLLKIERMLKGYVQALRTGGGDGEAGALDTSNIDLELLNSNKMHAQIARCTEELKYVCSVAEKILSLKGSRLRNWEVIEEFATRISVWGSNERRKR